MRNRFGHLCTVIRVVAHMDKTDGWSSAQIAFACEIRLLCKIVVSWMCRDVGYELWTCIGRVFVCLGHNLKMANMPPWADRRCNLQNMDAQPISLSRRRRCCCCCCDCCALMSRWAGEQQPENITADGRLARHATSKSSKPLPRCSSSRYTYIWLMSWTTMRSDNFVELHRQSPHGNIQLVTKLLATQYSKQKISAQNIK